MDNIERESSEITDQFWDRQEKIYRKAFITIGLLTINIVVFLISTFVAYPAVYNEGVLITERILNNGEFYRIATAIFLHADIKHLFNNMIILFLVGAVVENYTGHIYYVLVYFFSGFFGNILSMAYELKNSLNWVSLGASGAVMGIVGFLISWLIKNRREFFRSKGTVIRVVLLLVFVIQSCFFQEGANTVAHLGGFMTGFVLGVLNILVFKNDKMMEGLA